MMSDGQTVNENTIKIRLATGRLISASFKTFNVAKLLVHENYIHSTFENDIALLKIKESFDFTGDTRSICFTDMAELPQAAGGIAVGYGSTDDSKQNKYSDLLRQVDMPIVSQEECFDSDPDYFGRHLFEGNFCSGEIGVMKGVCSGKPTQCYIRTHNSRVHPVIHNLR